MSRWCRTRRGPGALGLRVGEGAAGVGELGREAVDVGLGLPALLPALPSPRELKLQRRDPPLVVGRLHRQPEHPLWSTSTSTLTRSRSHFATGIGGPAQRRLESERRPHRFVTISPLET
jgi:hypothetical protein